jgi:RimJ/RimL family protein N-acetyltransferase
MTATRHPKSNPAEVLGVRRNAHGQPIGAPVPDWRGAAEPQRVTREGHWCRVEPLNVARHARELFAAQCEDHSGERWTYMFAGPFTEFAPFEAWLQSMASTSDPLCFAIVERASGQAVGVASYLRIVPAHGVIEIGHIYYSPRVSRTVAATEAMYLLMEYAFSIGYRRYEWKCDSLNAPSRQAAQRYGFSYEGVFRQAIVYKGRSRDTAWYAIVDRDWPALQAAYLTWLDPNNFASGGSQRQRLSELTAPFVSTRG